MKVVAQNKNANRLFQIEEKFEAGAVLLGDEVKSIRNNAIQLKEGYARVRQGELFLIGVNISAYGNSSLRAYNPRRDRKLLVHKREILRLSALQERQGYTMVPLQVYFKGNKAKFEIGVGKGKREYDKREDIKKREAKRDIDRAFKKSRS